MIQQKMTLDQLKGLSLEDVLKAIADRQSSVTIRLADGREVVIGSKIQLKPLPELEGSVSAGWKTALYDGQ